MSTLLVSFKAFSTWYWFSLTPHQIDVHTGVLTYLTNTFLNNISHFTAATLNVDLQANQPEGPPTLAVVPKGFYPDSSKLSQPLNF